MLHSLKYSGNWKVLLKIVIPLCVPSLITGLLCLLIWQYLQLCDSVIERVPVIERVRSRNLLEE